MPDGTAFSRSDCPSRILSCFLLISGHPSFRDRGFMAFKAVKRFPLSPVAGSLQVTSPSAFFTSLPSSFSQISYSMISPSNRSFWRHRSLYRPCSSLPHGTLLLSGRDRIFKIGLPSGRPWYSMISLSMTSPAYPHILQDPCTTRIPYLWRKGYPSSGIAGPSAPQ